MRTSEKAPFYARDRTFFCPANEVWVVDFDFFRSFNKINLVSIISMILFNLVMSDGNDYVYKHID